MKNYKKNKTQCLIFLKSEITILNKKIHNNQKKKKKKKHTYIHTYIHTSKT